MCHDDGVSAPSPVEVEPDLRPDENTFVVKPWVTIVWNDPINLMSYVTYVLQEVFGYSKEKATKLMLDVHQKGRAAVSHGPRERMECDTEALQGYGLWATLQRDD